MLTRLPAKLPDAARSPRVSRAPQTSQFLTSGGLDAEMRLLDLCSAAVVATFLSACSGLCAQAVHIYSLIPHHLFLLCGQRGFMSSALARPGAS